MYRYMHIESRTRALPTAVLTAYEVPGTWQRSVSVAELCDHITCISSRIEESGRTQVVLDVEG